MQEIGTIETHASWTEIASDWTRLEQTCNISGYQTQRWVAPWLRTVGEAHGLAPLFILARDAGGAPAALFPLTVAHEASVRVASYAGGKDSNVNLPLVRPDVRLDASAIQRVLREGAQPVGVDAFTLCNQPVEWLGAAHPMRALPGQTAPSLLHSAELRGDGAAFTSRLTSDTRKRLRWRLRKLEEVGPVTFMQARTPGEVAAVVAAFRRQKKDRIAAIGASDSFDVDLVANFLEAAALSQEPGLELHALMAGERIIAIYGGVAHGACFHAMVNSYDLAPDVARVSPGDVITIRLLQSLSDRGFEYFDLGVGEAPYKDRWCDRHDPLFDTILGVTAKGTVYALAQRMKQQAKRRIKQSPLLWPLALKLRARLARDA